jgi:alcohol dehydrogenase
MMRIPEVVSGQNSLGKIGAVAKRLGIKRAFIVTDAVLVDLGMVQPCIDSLEAEGVEYTLFAEVKPNPDHLTAEHGCESYAATKCDGYGVVGSHFAAVACSRCRSASVCSHPGGGGGGGGLPPV